MHGQNCIFNTKNLKICVRTYQNMLSPLKKAIDTPVAQFGIHSEN